MGMKSMLSAASIHRPGSRDCVSVPGLQELQSMEACGPQLPQQQHCKVLPQAFAGEQGWCSLRQLLSIKAWKPGKLKRFCSLHAAEAVLASYTACLGMQK